MTFNIFYDDCCLLHAICDLLSVTCNLLLFFLKRAITCKNLFLSLVVVRLVIFLVIMSRSLSVFVSMYLCIFLQFADFDSKWALRNVSCPFYGQVSLYKRSNGHKVKISVCVSVCVCMSLCCHIETSSDRSKTNISTGWPNRFSR